MTLDDRERRNVTLAEIQVLRSTPEKLERQTHTIMPNNSIFSFQKYYLSLVLFLID